MDEPVAYAVLIDRISHEVPYYRSYLKHAVLQGATVVNNPFMWTADDKFFGASLATKLGVANPKTVALPNKDYVPGHQPRREPAQPRYPLDWQAIVDYVGLPCILKDAHGGGWKDVYVCHTHRGTDRQLQRVRPADDDRAGVHQVGPVRPLPVPRPGRTCCRCSTTRSERKYLVEHDHLSPELGDADRRATRERSCARSATT